MPSEFLYPLDVTGKASTNRVVLERQTLSAPVGNFDYHFIVTKAGPYYRDSLKLRHIQTNRTLVRGTDWFPGHLFKSASEETEYVEGGIYQSILFADRTLSGQVEILSYNVLGGDWSLEESKLLEILSNKTVDPRQVVFEQVSGKPEVFPPINHPHPADDMVGMREQVEATYQVSAAIRERTADLPRELQLILEFYYDRNQVDAIITNLTTSLLEGVAGPELERMLQDVLNNLIGDYYNKSQVDQIVGGLSAQLLQRYTKTEVNNLLANKVTDVQLNTAIASFATYSDVSSAIASIQQGAVTSAMLNQAVAALSAVDTAQQGEIDTIKTLVNNLGGNFDDFVKTEDLQALIPEQTWDATTFPPALTRTITDGILTRTVNVTVLSAVVEGGVIKSAELMIPTGSIITIVPRFPVGSASEEVTLAATLVEYDATAEWEAAGFSTKEEMWNDVKTKLVGFTLRLAVNKTTGTATVVIEAANILNNDIVPSVNSVINYDLGPLGMTSSTDMLLSRGYVEGGAVKIENYANANSYGIVEVQEVQLNNATSVSTLAATLTFRHDFGPDYSSTVTGVRLLDEEGTVLGVCGYIHNHIPRISNKVTVFKPPIDLAAYGPSSNLRIEVTVNTRTLR